MYLLLILFVFQDVTITSLLPKDEDIIKGNNLLTFLSLFSTFIESVIF
jgi:hypothetical protein